MLRPARYLPTSSPTVGARVAGRGTRALGPRRILAPRLTAGLGVVLGLALVAPLGAQERPEAVGNDQRQPAGRIVDGELRIELEVVEAVWFPRGPEGPRITTPAFAELGRAPSVPGPLIRMEAGVPVRVTVHNRLGVDVQVRGLGDRRALPPAQGFPSSFSTDSLVVPAGGQAETRFRPESASSSIYFGRRVPEPGAGGFVAPMYVPGGNAEEGALTGAFVVDEAPPHPDERIIVINRWGSPEEPTSLDVSWKMTLNGRSWPHTERIEAVVGDTLRWRVINASLVDHPMHLHGFYFTVEGSGDGQVDTTIPVEDRREVVTEVMSEISSMRLRWVPERPGNWLFHCHLIRHMGELQRFQSEREASGAHTDEMDGMAGMILGISVRPRPGETETDPPPSRRIDLWTGTRPGVFGDAPEHGFVIQDGEVPAPDSTRVPGSPLVLTRGEPTEIVVHNRLSFPLSVHWHGLELRSAYDGVGDWSGMPDRTVPPVPMGGSQRVIIEPVRSGTFFYHTHGEPGHELTQGLYGAFLVLEPGEPWDRERDRVFVLGSRGAERDADPAVNGRVTPSVERFQPGEAVRLRFAHISADAFKRVRLLRGDELQEWRPWAKDGADLPPAGRTPGPAVLGLGVGEAADVHWTPRETGVFVLEVTTEFYPSRGGTEVQRIPFVVGEATVAEIREAVTGTALETVSLTDEEAARYAGTFVPESGAEDGPVLAVWALPQGLFAELEDEARGEGSFLLVALGGHEFTPGRAAEGLLRTPEPERRVRFTPAGDGAIDGVLFETAGGQSLRLRRSTGYALPAEALERWVGAYTGPSLPPGVRVDTDGEGLLFTLLGRTTPVRPLSRHRFIVAGDGPAPPPGTVFHFFEEEGATILRIVAPDGFQARLVRER